MAELQSVHSDEGICLDGQSGSNASLSAHSIPTLSIQLGNSDDESEPETSPISQINTLSEPVHGDTTADEYTENEAPPLPYPSEGFYEVSDEAVFSNSNVSLVTAYSYDAYTPSGYEAMYVYDTSQIQQPQQQGQNYYYVTAPYIQYPDTPVQFSLQYAPPSESSSFYYPDTPQEQQQQNEFIGMVSENHETSTAIETQSNLYEDKQQIYFEEAEAVNENLCEHDDGDDKEQIETENQDKIDGVDVTSSKSWGSCVEEPEESVVAMKRDEWDLESNYLESPRTFDEPEDSLCLSETESFPRVYVSPAGLLTVLLKENIAVEMTLDKTIRVVNHGHKTVATTNSRGTSSCVFHDAARMFQDGTRVSVDIVGGRRVQMSTGNILFGLEDICFNLSSEGMRMARGEFTDLSKDLSVSLLFSASGYGPHFIPTYNEVAAAAQYTKHSRGAFTVIINGSRIYQNGLGDVSVSCGPKFIRVSPSRGTIHVATHFVEMSVEQHGHVWVRRGIQRMHISPKMYSITDGTLECGFNEEDKVFSRPLVVTKTTLIQDGRHVNNESDERSEDDVTAEGDPGQSDYFSSRSDTPKSAVDFSLEDALHAEVKGRSYRKRNNRRRPVYTLGSSMG